ncbi:monothiol glutaredoxin-S11 [Canna indica]|uniref:Monothiol glutaredoxin-S11 n=1 Tax=Canna indica TaxID=4628 RepID=A0AAQ3JZ91_9LILI|nr:monothiol glutaredoxin-S11 [Canna indica]
MGGRSSGVVQDVRSKADLDEALRGAAPMVVHFWASWCDASKQMDQVFIHLATDFPHALFLRVEAEEQPSISEAYAVSAVPCFVFFKDGKCVETLEGANPSILANKVAKVVGPANLAQSASPASLGIAAGPTILEAVQDMAKENVPSNNKNLNSELSDGLTKRLKQLVNSHHVFLFMKGSPEQPKCGFSQKVVEILKGEGVEFGSFDILTDNEVREGMKKFSNWPTFPQLFCKGELLGGCDIVVAMHENGELNVVLRDHGIPTISKAKNLTESAKGSMPEKGGGLCDSTDLSVEVASRLRTLVNSSPVMVFMKGRPEEPKCGFSHKVIEILQQEKVAFESFDVLYDDEVRQGMKVFSNWSSYPQVYIGGELIGGSDILLEMQKSGELKKILAEKGTIAKVNLERLKNLVISSLVMLFMKGTPDAPRCGFSSKVVDVLQKEGISFGYFDILTDEEVRQGLKTFSNWPTYPQLYCKGELIGGCDIVLELHSEGKLKFTLSE